MYIYTDSYSICLHLPIDLSHENLEKIWEKLPEVPLTEAQKQEKARNPPKPVKIDYSMSAVLRILQCDNTIKSDPDIPDNKSADKRRSSDVILVERHTDDDLKDLQDPDPEDIEFQMNRLSQGELTKEEKKRWRRRYRGEAVFMVIYITLCVNVLL